MLAKKYKKEFLSINNNSDLKGVMNKIIEKEDEYKSKCIDWTIEQIKEFLKDLNYESPNTISRAFSFYKNFVKYICNEEQLDCPEYDIQFGTLYDLVDYDKLLNTTISYEQFRHIYNQLDKNPRDRCLFGLPWHVMLTNEDVKNIKEKDVRFEEEDGLDVAYIIVDDREIKVEDFELVDDLKQCLRRFDYTIKTKNDKDKKYKLKETDYFIKPMNVGKKGKDDDISNPSIALQKVFKREYITCPGVDILLLTISNIRRSKIIYLLAPQNEKYFDNELITHFLDAGNIDSNLFWLKKVARMKYKKKNNDLGD